MSVGRKKAEKKKEGVKLMTEGMSRGVTSLETPEEKTWILFTHTQKIWVRH